MLLDFDSSQRLGVVSAIGGNILISFALNIQRLAHVTSQQTEESERETETERKSYLANPFWWIGLILIITGEFGNFFAYSLCPSVVIAPLGVVTIISNTLIAPTIFYEPFRCGQLVGVIFAIFGTLIIIVTGPSEDPNVWKPGEISKAFSTLAFRTFFLVSLSLMFILIFVAMRYKPASGDDNQQPRPSSFLLANLGITAIFGAYTVMCTKSLSSLLTNDLFEALGYPLTYLLAFLLALTAIAQIRYLNIALHYFPAVQVVPIHFCMFTLSVIVGSASLEYRFIQETLSRALLFLGGCLVVFLGVWMVTSISDSGADHEMSLQREETDLDEPVLHHNMSANFSGEFGGDLYTSLPQTRSPSINSQVIDEETSPLIQSMTTLERRRQFPQAYHLQPSALSSRLSMDLLRARRIPRRWSSSSLQHRDSSSSLAIASPIVMGAGMSIFVENIMHSPSKRTGLFVKRSPAVTGGEASRSPAQDYEDGLL